jgi:hypothetical protein
MLTNVRLVRGWHAVLAAVVAFAVIGQVAVDAHMGRSLVNTLSFFTIESNVIVGVGAVLVALDPLRRGPLSEAVRLAGLVGITVTGVVYNALLAGSTDVQGADVLFNLLLHKVIPVATLVGFLFLRPRSELGPRSWWFLTWPIVWLGYTLVRAEVSDARFERLHGTSRVPYDFLDRRDIGWGGVSIYVVVILGVALLLAWGLVRLSRPGSQEDEHAAAPAH